ncbi:MAG: hypothetical protein FH761_08450 [Firmicutes bacterium]|nr:hypothetical protein [Bacillota bacterium]
MFKSIKLAHYRIIPDYTIDNSNNIAISNSIASTYKTFLQRKKIGKKPLLTIEPKKHIYFNVLLLQGGANFYISFPIQYEDMFVNKMKTIWNRSAIQKIDIKEFQDWQEEETEIADLMLKDYNFKSLNTDKSNLYPLTNLLGISKDLKDDEKVMINFDIEPMNRLDWVNRAKDECKSYDKGKIVDNTRSALQELASNLFKTVEVLLNIYIEFKILIFESIAGLIVTQNEEEKQKFELSIDSLEAIRKENKLNSLSHSTHHKLTSKAYKTAISIMSQSEDRNRREVNLIATANAYKDLTGNNELITKRLRKKRQQAKFKKIIHFESKSTIIENKSIYSDKEIAKFIQLPQKHLQNEYSIENIDERELEVHDDLLKKGIKIGTAEHQKKLINTYWCNDYNSMALPKVIGGPMGAGKTEYTSNYIVDANQQGHCTITFDYIKNCEMSKKAIKYTTNNVVINLSNPEIAFAYPEISNTLNENSTKWDRLDVANDISHQVRYLVDSITDNNTGPLTAQMRRYLSAACKIVFIHAGETIDNMFKVLEDWKTRNEYMRKSKGVYDYDDRVLNILRELNDKDDKGKVIGTRYDLLKGILNRADILMDDIRLQKMLTLDIDNKHNFLDYMNNGNAVYILMPQKYFKDPLIKDIIVTYFMTRIWTAAQARSEIDKPNITHIITDEIHQIPTAASFFSGHITEFRKFGLAPYFTVHYFKQFRMLLDAIKSAGVSYMLLNGIEKENVMSLQEEIKPFEVEEVLRLKEWETVNVIRHNNKYSRFISKLPKPLA